MCIYKFICFFYCNFTQNYAICVWLMNIRLKEIASALDVSGSTVSRQLFHGKFGDTGKRNAPGGSEGILCLVKSGAKLRQNKLSGGKQYDRKTCHEIKKEVL